MPTIPYGKLAIANNKNTHQFNKGEKIMFIEFDSEVNVNEEYEKYYIFKSLNRNLTFTLTEDEFDWS